MSEELFSAKLFLTSAFHEAILSLLCDDEMFLDIDPAKTVVRFSPSERGKKFGKEGSPDYAKNVKQHRAFVCSKLESLTNKFIAGIRQNVHCFPPSLARLLRAMYSMLMARGRLEPRTVNAMCVDVLFSLFICPAIVDPHPAGIVDTPISNVARSNLIQVAQILQVLALWKWEEIDPRLMDLYSRFDKDSLTLVLDNMLEQSSDPYVGGGTATSSITSEDDIELDLGYLDDALSMMTFEPSGNSSTSAMAMNNPNRLGRMAILLTSEEMEQLIEFLRSLQGHSDFSEVDAVELTTLLDPLPDKLPANANKHLTATNKQSTTIQRAASSSEDSGASSALSSMMAKKQMLSNKLSTALAVNKRSSSMTASTPSTPGSDDVPTGMVVDASAGVTPSPGQPPNSHNGNNNSSGSSGAENGGDFIDETAVFHQCEPDTVMVVPLPDRNCEDPPGFLSEEHVVSRSRQASRVVRIANLPGADDEDDMEVGSIDCALV